MSNLTPNLELFKYNLSTDGREPFNITQSLNNNWDTLDNAYLTLDNKINNISILPDQEGNSGKFLMTDGNSPSWSNINSLSATTYLATNGYIKFSNKFLINYGKATSSSGDVTFTRPNLSSNGTLGGSKFAVAASGNNSTNYAYKAVNGDNSTYWSSAAIGSGGSAWFTFYNPSALKVTKLNITNTSICKIKAYSVLASSDNSNWTTLTSGTNSNSTGGSTWSISLSSNTRYYKYYKINVTSNYTSGGQYAMIAELGIVATYVATASNSITFPEAFTTTNYSPALGYYGGSPETSYIKSVSKTGMTLQNNGNASSVYYVAMGY